MTDSTTWNISAGSGTSASLGVTEQRVHEAVIEPETFQSLGPNELVMVETEASRRADLDLPSQLAVRRALEP